MRPGIRSLPWNDPEQSAIHTPSRGKSITRCGVVRSDASAITLAESGNLLMMRERARDQGDWMKDAKMLVDVGTAAYKAAQNKDTKALARCIRTFGRKEEQAK